MSRRAATLQNTQPADALLIATIVTLLAGGLVMLTSASISLADKGTGEPFFYLYRQLTAIFIGLAGGAACLYIPTNVWRATGPFALLLSFALLVAVLLPGFGSTVNGSTRWLAIGGVNIVQVSEPARLLFLIYICGYAVRHHEELGGGFSGFLKPMLVTALASALLLAQPDFGAAALLLTICMAVLFVAGARIRDFLIFLVAVGGALAMLAISSPYRMKRISSFLNPWDDPFDSGFQLTQSLIAIGSGEWFGVGLGSSVQKLFYLPEAHTDFVFAVVAEEFGLVGSLCVILVFGLLVWRGVRISLDAMKAQKSFQACLAFGIATWLGTQAFINLGVNMGVLPTKGLTLPMISFGRSSIVVTLIALGILLRIDAEIRSLPAKGRRRRQ
jgi:cell division protein FtsW